MPLLIIVGGAIALVVILGLIQNLKQKRHTRRLRGRAEQLGLSFSEEGDARLYSQAHRFVLFSQGRTGQTQNLMQGRRPTGEDDEVVDVALFEYIFTTPFGRYVENWRQTVARIHDDTLDLPTFSVTPEPIFNAILENAREPELRERLVGTPSLDFPAHPAFDKEMHVQGPDRSAIRPLFNDDLIALYEDSGVLCTEGSGPYLLFYRYDHLMAPDEIEGFLEMAMAAYRLYREQRGEAESANGRISE